MDYAKGKEPKSLYDYLDKSIPQAGQAAIVYGVVYLGGALFAWFRAPGTSWFGAAAVGGALAIIIAALAVGIFKKSRIAVLLMLVWVVGLQLYTWFVQQSPSGTVVSIIVTGFLLRGAKRIFEAHREADPSHILSK